MDESFIVSGENAISCAKKFEPLKNHWEMIFQNLEISPDEAKTLQYTNREFLINSQMDVLKTCQETKMQQNGKGFICVHNSVIHEIQHPGKLKMTELISLNKIEISDLTASINTPVTGKFLLCRNITPPLKMTAFTTILDDPTGQAVRLSLYNFTAATSNLHQIMPIGTVLAIKDPLFKSSADGGLILRCDNPESVVYVDETLNHKEFSDIKWIMEIPRSFNNIYTNYASNKYVDKIEIVDNESEALHWKNIGNCLFQKKDYTSAIRAYSFGLKTSPLNVDLLSNRCAAYLKLCWFTCCLTDAETILTKDPHHLKSVCRKSKALCGLNKCKEAVCFLSGMIAQMPIKSPNRKTWNFVLEATIQMQQQQECGIFPIGKLLEKKHIRLESCTEYTASIKIGEIQDKGRGLIATHNISAGTLIIASRAFEIDFRNPGDGKGYHFNLIKSTKAVELQDHKDLTQQIAQRLMAEPESRKEFYDLYAGSEYSDDCNPNSIAPAESVDLKRIQKICKFNSFKISESGQGLIIEENVPAGIWLLPSYINNSCSDANCTWNIYGDFMFIRSSRDIAISEEILISYMHPTNSFELREKIFKEVYDFICKCSLCLEDRNKTVNASTRNATIKMFYNDRQNNNVDIQKLNHYLEVVRNCPRDPNILNTELIALLVEMSMQHTHFTKNPEMAAKTLEEAYSLVGSSALVDYKVNISKYLVAVYLQLNSCGKNPNNPRRSTQYFKIAEEWAVKFKTDLQLTYGKDVDIMDVVSKIFLNFVKSEGIQI